MLVKAVANATKASFIRVVGSEFVQKYLGEVSHSFVRLEILLTCRDQEWYEMSSVSHVRTRLVSSLSMKSMQSPRNDSMLKQDQIEKYSVSSSNSSIKWTVSTSRT